MHELESVLQSISLHDSLTLEARDQGISLEVDDPSVPSGPDNLAWRAALILPSASSFPRGVHIRIRKAIPVGSGLGGGSSDAAAVLVGLRRLWQLDLTDQDLATLGAELGTDVPFFLVGGTALVRGTGTIVEPLEDLTGYEVLVVFTGVPLSTKEVYSGASAALTSALKISSMARFKPTPEGNSKAVETWVRAGNDLEPYARSRCPAIGEIEAHLRAAGSVAAAMTGSGSAVFGIFRGPTTIEGALAGLSRLGFAASRCAPLRREEYRKNAGFA